MQTLARAMKGEALQSLPMFARALAVARGDPELADLRLMLQINQATMDRLGVSFPTEVLDEATLQ